jgi:hypothetical protein
VFSKFAELQSVRQVHLWFRHEHLPIPAIIYGDDARRIEWKLPICNTILKILKNPIYAGAYAYGRTTNRVTIEGSTSSFAAMPRRMPLSTIARSSMRCWTSPTPATRCASVHDSQKLDEVLDQSNTSNEVWADSAYRSRVEHVFGDQENAMGGIFVRTIGIARAAMKIGMMNLVYNMRRLVSLQRIATAPG